MPAGRFVEALKKCLRGRGMTYAALARELRISEASVKRMFSRSSFTLSRIEEILAAIDLDLHEVARMSLASAAGPTELTLDQETALAKDERLISVFWLVLNGWRYEQIAEAFSISRAELTLVFARLDRLKLIEWGKGERARLRVAKDFQWRGGGAGGEGFWRRGPRGILQARVRSPLQPLRVATRAPVPRASVAAQAA